MRLFDSTIDSVVCSRTGAITLRVTTPLCEGASVVVPVKTSSYREVTAGSTVNATTPDALVSPVRTSTSVLPTQWSR